MTSLMHHQYPVDFANNTVRHITGWKFFHTALSRNMGFLKSLNKTHQKKKLKTIQELECIA